MFVTDGFRVTPFFGCSPGISWDLHLPAIRLIGGWNLEDLLGTEKMFRT